MTAPAKRLSPVGRPTSWVRWGTAVCAAAVLALLNLPGAAQADGPGYDPVSGVGPTASAVTVPWTQGLLDASNNPITSAGTELSPNSDRSSSNPTSKLAFMYNDFKNLSVTVSQTQDITHQGIAISWTWTGHPTDETASFPQSNFLQMMECYGDAAQGPTAEQCEYGSSGMIGNQINQGIGQRLGQQCQNPNAVPSTSNPPTDQNGNICDTQETDSAATTPKCPASTCSGGTFDIPFVPVDDATSPDYGIGDTTYYSQFNTDEIQQAVTGKNGTGQQQFETLTGVQAPGLGCGLPDASNNNQPRNCWLVIVPRGQYEPNGLLYNKYRSLEPLSTSPLSASNWAQRIQIHLSFASAPQFCPISTLERQAVGTQMVSRAMQSWELALNHGTNCTKIYTFTAVPESTATSQLADPTTGIGLAMTTIPIGSEATRTGGSPPSSLPPMLYAPVAVSALGFGFNINSPTGYYGTPVNLTPVLLAKALTQSYVDDLPQYFPNNPDGQSVPAPAWAKANPQDISHDPAFTKINPGIPQVITPPADPLLTEEHSALTQQVWQWIQGDSAASTWLGGTADANDNNMVVNPVYKAINLGKAPAIDNYPRADDGGSSPGQCASLGEAKSNPPKAITRCALDLLPYTDNYDSAAATVLAANNPSTGNWSDQQAAPDGSFGWWLKVGAEPFGQIWMWAATDTSNMAAYGLIPAHLCNDDGSSCVGPTSASLTAALTAAKPDSSGLLQVDPTNPGNGGYPLTIVTYAAVSTKQDPTALNDYANLIAYAAGQGQTVGSAQGDLPPGYLPMPSSLQAQAQAVVTKLRNLANASPSPSPTSSSPATHPTSGTTPGGPSTQPGTRGGNNNTGSTPTRGATPAPTAGTTPAPGSSSSHPAAAPASSAPSGGPSTSFPAAQPVAGKTPRQIVGDLRWALIGVAVAGGGAAGGGTLLRSGGIPLWLRRRKPG